MAGVITDSSWRWYAPRRWRKACLATLVLTISSCGGGGGGTPTTPTQPPTGTPGLTVTITSMGASPRALTVAVGARVLFINNDARPHEMTSDPHPTHEDCPELNQVGFLNPGQQRESGNLVMARTCGFHDHINPEAPSLIGSISIR